MMKRAGGGMRRVCVSDGLPTQEAMCPTTSLVAGRSTAVDTEGGKSFRRIRLTLLLRPLKVDY